MRLLPSVENGSLGLVVERRRYDGEVDGLRWFTDFEKCDQILYEKYFQCFDLGRDLVPVVKEYLASDEKATMVPSEESVLASPPFEVDVHSVIPAPFRLQTWLDEHRAELERGHVLNLFPGHPDKEICVRVCGGAVDTGSRQVSACGTRMREFLRSHNVIGTTSVAL
jgi:3-hydroxyanthranilate 3,4-dioxygenase